jgi:uncharacterized repeat protein (TIGR01451 family)
MQTSRRQEHVPATLTVRLIIPMLVSTIAVLALLGTAAAAQKADAAKSDKAAASEPNRAGGDYTYKFLRRISRPGDKNTEQVPEKKASEPNAATPPKPQPPKKVEQPAAAEPDGTVVHKMHTVSRMYPTPTDGVVRLDKTMPTRVELNEPFTYLIRVTNVKDNPLTSIQITEYLPTNFRLLNAKPTSRVLDQRLAWQIPVLEPKASVEMSVSGAADTTQSLVHFTSITYVIPLFSKVEVVQSKLELNMATVAEASACDPIPLEIALENVGTAPLDNVRIVDLLPEGLRTADGESKLVIDAGDIDPGQSRKFSARLVATRTGVFTHKAVAITGSSLKAEAKEVTTTVDKPQLEITNIGPVRQILGNTVTYDVTVTNNSKLPATNATLYNIVPPGVSSMKATTGAELSGSKLVWDLGTLAPGASRKVAVCFLPSQACTLANNAGATARCADSVTASAETKVVGMPALILEVVDANDPVRVGAQTTYLITVANQGSAPGTGVTIACLLEDAVQYVSSQGPTAGSVNANQLTFAPLETLAPQAKATWRVVVKAVKPGDVRFKVGMTSQQLTRPVEDTEATQLYE